MICGTPVHHFFVSRASQQSQAAQNIPAGAHGFGRGLALGVSDVGVAPLPLFETGVPCAAPPPARGFNDLTVCLQLPDCLSIFVFKRLLETQMLEHNDNSS